MAKLAMIDVSKTYPGGHEAVRRMNLETSDGELVVVVGPSGCGKTTALRMIAGLEEVTSGRVELDGALLNHVDPGARDVAMVFQNYALYPHLSVYGNLMFPLKERKVRKAERDQRVRDVARVLGLDSQLTKKPGQLSGGQRQRVAMGRAIVRHPRLFLMDEPLSNLDAKLRVEMRTELHAIQRRLGITTIYVTHDQVEAMTLSDRVVVMHAGEVQQIGTPTDVYDTPANVFVATFLGNPGANLFKAALVDGGGRPAVRIGERQLAIDDVELARQPAVGERVGADVTVGVRPEALAIHSDGPAASARQIPGTVALTEALGASVLAYFETPAVLSGFADDDAAEEPLSESTASGSLTRREWAVARTSAGSTFAERESLEVTVGPGTMRFFEASSGVAL
jgi:multiple sugar transport system ATP-binding protein